MKSIFSSITILLCISYLLWSSCLVTTAQSSLEDVTTQNKSTAAATVHTASTVSINRLKGCLKKKIYIIF